MSPFHLGFACVWNRDGDRSRTWSHTPLRLWEALERRDDVLIHDVPIVLPRLIDLAGRALSARIVNGRPWSSWALRPTYSRFAHRALTRSVSRAGSVDAVLDIGEQGPIGRPLYVYQDHCFGHGLEMYHNTGTLPDGWKNVPMRSLVRRAEMQAETYATCSGVFTMSQWNADYLVRSGLLEAGRVHVVHSGINVPVIAPSQEEFERKRARNEKVVLFAGRDFFRKGGDLVVQAFSHVKRMSNRPIRLVIAGPKEWPMTGPIPANIDFIGDASFDTLRDQMRMADVMVMPSRFEAFGIVFVEALAAGTPVIGRKAFAMPEMITPGKNGFLVEHDDALELAELIARVIEDDEMAKYCRCSAHEVAAKYSWDRVAADMMDVMKKSHRS